MISNRYTNFKITGFIRQYRCIVFINYDLSINVDRSSGDWNTGIAFQSKIGRVVLIIIINPIFTFIISACICSCKLLISIIVFIDNSWTCNIFISIIQSGQISTIYLYVGREHLSGIVQYFSFKDKGGLIDKINFIYHL